MSKIITRLNRCHQGRNVYVLHKAWPKAVFSLFPSARHLSSTDYSQELFEYTSGRWLYNESIRLSERRLVFNVTELKRIAAQCLNQPEHKVRKFSKLAEGGFNRVFQVTMEDGSEVLARLPYPSTKPDRLALASEVATLDLARISGVPVPKVLHYSTDAANPVGAEFMIMEKLSGFPIGSRWYGLSEKQRVKITLKVVEIESKLFKIDLPAYGSIYYEHDLPDKTPRIAFAPTPGSKGFCIGPYVDLRWWYEERSSLQIERGPHSDPVQALSCIATKELAWLKAFGYPRLPFERIYREYINYQKSSPEEHMNSLREYLDIVPYLVPQETKFHRPTLRHPDLQPNNIFVSEDFDIIGIIDWQHCSVLPGFLAASIPKYFQNYHDEESLRFVVPKLPNGLAEMGDEERAEALERYRRRHLHFFYLGFTERFNPDHFEILKRPVDILTRKMFDHASAPWEGNNIPLRADLLHTTQVWQELLKCNGHNAEAAAQSPISFTKTEGDRISTILQEQEETDTAVVNIRNAIGVTTDGWTSHEDYEGAVERAKFFKEQLLERLDDEKEKEMVVKHWPFDDFDEEGRDD